MIMNESETFGKQDVRKGMVTRAQTSVLLSCLDIQCGGRYSSHISTGFSVLLHRSGILVVL
jgi:hypothetical protein